jgi:hypothetical protein
VAFAAMSVALGIVVRWPLVTHADFPLNDGGLFLVFIDTIRDGGFAFPHFIEWNGYQIPFAYPPLSFYGVAALSALTGAAPLELIQYFPLFFNMLAIPLFVWIAARLLTSRTSLFFAAFVFPLIPRSYEWLIMGGGVSRSPAMVAVLVAMLFTMSAIDRRQTRFFVAASGALGLALTMHLEWGISGWVVTTLLILMARPTRASVGIVVAIGLGMGLVSFPWWASVLAIHGIDPFLAAMTTGGWDGETFSTRMTTFDLFTLPRTWIAVLGAFGFGFAWASRDRRQLLVLLWLLLIYVTTPRHAKTVAAIPVAMLIGISLEKLTGWLDAQLRRGAESSEGAPSSPPHRLVTLLLHGILAVSVFGYMLWEGENSQEPSPLVALTPGERAGMSWIGQNVDESAHFLVVSRSLIWASDRAAEWFPLLAHRRSVNTLQGLEWVREVPFESELLRSEMHRQAAYLSPAVAPQYGLQLFGATHDHVAVFAPRNQGIRRAYADSNLYEPLYEQDEVAIYRVRPDILAAMTTPPSPPATQ